MKYASPMEMWRSESTPSYESGSWYESTNVEEDNW